MGAAIGKIADQLRGKESIEPAPATGDAAVGEIIGPETGAVAGKIETPDIDPTLVKLSPADTDAPSITDTSMPDVDPTVLKFYPADTDPTTLKFSPPDTDASSITDTSMPDAYPLATKNLAPDTDATAISDSTKPSGEASILDTTTPGGADIDEDGPTTLLADKGEYVDAGGVDDAAATADLPAGDDLENLLGG